MIPDHKVAFGGGWGYPLDAHAPMDSIRRHPGMLNSVVGKSGSDT